MSDSGKVAVIGASARVRGRIAGDEDVVIHGRVEGEIDLRGALRVEAGGVVRAQVRAAAARIRGVVVGDLVVTDVVHLAATARVIGDVRAARLVIEPGAQISGAVTIEGEAKADTGARRSFGAVEVPRTRARSDEQPRAPSGATEERPTELPPAARVEPVTPRDQTIPARAETAPARAETARPEPAPTAARAQPVVARELTPMSWRPAPRVPDPRPIAHATVFPAEEPARARRPGPPTVEPDPPSDPPRAHDATEHADALPHPSVVLTHRPDDSSRRRVLVKLRRRGEGS